MKLLVTAEARHDLREINKYSQENWGVDRAKSYVLDIRSHFRMLVSGELSGMAVGEVAEGLRRLVVGSHVIWFRVEGDALRVVRVLHGSRDAGRWV